MNGLVCVSTTINDMIKITLLLHNKEFSFVENINGICSDISRENVINKYGINIMKYLFITGIK